MRQFLIVLCTSICLCAVFIPSGMAEARLVPIECRDPQHCGTCEFIQLINNVIQFTLAVSSLIAVLLFIYAGFRLLTSGGNTGAATAARSTLTNVAIGYVLLLAAFLIIDTVMSALLPGGSQSLGWKEVQCIYPIEAHETARSATSSIAIGGAAAGGPLTQCGSGNIACSVEALQAAGMTAEQASVMSCIAMTESSGNPSARNPSPSSSACGTFQILRSTWEGAASGNCASFSQCTDAACNAKVAQTLVSQNGYNDWTCPGCNNKATQCITQYGS